MLFRYHANFELPLLRCQLLTIVFIIINLFLVFKEIDDLKTNLLAFDNNNKTSFVNFPKNSALENAKLEIYEDLKKFKVSKRIFIGLKMLYIMEQCH